MSLDALTIATGGLLAGDALAIAAVGLLPPVVPDVAPVLLGRRPKINRTKENDEALLLALGML